VTDVTGVAIPYGGALWYRRQKTKWLHGNVLFSAHLVHGNLMGIATPVCALVRNDVLFYGAA
jgi:hypothetical protein